MLLKEQHPKTKLENITTRGDQKVRRKMLLNCIVFIDCNKNS